jgi:hypothetical protein
VKYNDIAILSFGSFLGRRFAKAGESRWQTYWEVLKRGGAKISRESLCM